MKERPILFKGEMVRAILSGQKTQTRRMVKGEMLSNLGDLPHVPDWIVVELPRLCPYGQVGDRLWVRETFLGWYNTADGSFSHVAAFAADGYELEGAEKWMPSIHMPRQASRITLEITDVRVERLQDISDGDAIAEGVDRTNTSIPGYAIERYRKLWESINGPGSWDANPWVWVVSFRRIES